MHIVGFDLVSFWFGFAAGVAALLIFLIVLAVVINKKHDKDADRVLRKEFPELYENMKKEKKNG